VFDGIKDTIGGILETASLLTSTVGGVLGSALIGAGVAGKKLLDTSYQLGGSLLDTSNISTTLFGTVFEDAVGTTKSLSKEFGGLSDVSLTTQFRTNVIAKNLGIGASEAAALTGQFARLNDGSASTAQNLIQQTKNLAQQNGLVPADVMADVANSAEAFALFGKDGGTNIAEAAVAAGKLGVSMSQISGIADNLLDFESSINAELQLGAMLGKNINLDRARALAYEGDLGGMVRETLSSLGGIEEFNKMDVFQKREVAKLLGVSADEFQKMAEDADKLGKNGEVIPTQYEATLNTMKAFGSQIFSGIQGLGSMAIAAGQMGFSLKDGLASMKGMGGLGGKIGKIFSKGAPTMAGPLTKAGKPDMRFNSNKGLGKMSKGGGMGGMMKGMGAGMKGMASGFAAFANPATLLGLAAITAGIIGIGYALKVAAPGIESLGKAIGSIVGAATFNAYPIPIIPAVIAANPNKVAGLANAAKPEAIPFIPAPIPFIIPPIPPPLDIFPNPLLELNLISGLPALVSGPAIVGAPLLNIFPIFPPKPPIPFIDAKPSFKLKPICPAAIAILPNP
jgi:hypothetical protein